MLKSNGTVATTSSGVLPSSTRAAARAREERRVTSLHVVPVPGEVHDEFTFEGHRPLRKSARAGDRACEIGVPRPASSSANGPGAGAVALLSPAVAAPIGRSRAARRWRHRTALRARAAPSAGRSRDRRTRARARTANRSGTRRSSSVCALMKSKLAGRKRVAPLLAEAQRPPCAPDRAARAADSSTMASASRQANSPSTARTRSLRRAMAGLTNGEPLHPFGVNRAKRALQPRGRIGQHGSRFSHRAAP